ncbi:MAG: CHASE domain-containing protein, partial [Candidatus Omnitrophota bacterium]|nr:CHASE domain-containing protein [Candidatus Omnitrophota bacterium]
MRKHDNRNPEQPKVFAFDFLIFLILALLLAWPAGHATALQLSSAPPPVTYNTSIALLLAGFGLLGVVGRRYGVAMACGGIIFFMGILGVIEYLVDASRIFGWLLFPFPLLVENDPMGPATPSSALYLLMIGLALIFADNARRDEKIRWGLFFLGNLIFSLSAVSLTASLLNPAGASSTSGIPAVSFLSLLGYALTGGILVAINWPSSIQFRAVKITTLICIPLSLLIVMLLQHWQIQSIKSRFEKEAQQRALLMGREIKISLEAIHSLKALYDSSVQVEREEFKEFSRTVLSNHPTIRALEWAPRVLAGQREIFEGGQFLTGVQDLAIPVLDPHGRPAEPRPEYLPLFYIEPGGDPSRLGLDLGAVPEEQGVLRQVHRTGASGIGENFILGGHSVFRVYVPVFNKAGSSSPEHFQGVIVGVLSQADIFNAALTYVPPVGIDIGLYDATPGREKKLLFYHRSRTAEKGREEWAPAPLLRKLDKIVFSTTVDVLDHHWEIMCVPTPQFYDSDNTWLPWGMLAILLISNVLLLRYLWVSAVYRADIEKKVTERTTALTAANAALKDTNVHLERYSDELQMVQTALREGEQQYRQTLDAIADMVLVKGPKSVIIWANKAFCDYYGMTNEQLQGRIDAAFNEPSYTQQYLFDDAHV